MIDKKNISQLIESWLADKDTFLVDVIMDSSNKIVVEIDNKEGIDIDECAALNLYIREQLDKDIDNYELEVGSAGITSPFKVLKQYEKNIGNEVEVLTKSGLKVSGVLKSANGEDFVITTTKKVKPEGAKRKIEIEEDIPFKYSEIKLTKYLIRFK